jgi:hypothetical protein
MIYPLDPTHQVTSLTFSYRYCYGYAKTGIGANFTLNVASTPAYASPHFEDYPYPGPYSPPVNVTVNTLAIAVPRYSLNTVLIQHCTH